MKPTRTLLLLALLGSAPAVFGADLLQTYRDALAQDAAFGSAKAAYQAGLEKLPQARAGLLPSLSLSANANRVRSELEGISTSNYSNRGYTLSLSQPLFRAQNVVAYNQAKQQISQVEAQFLGAQQDLAVRVAQAYFDVLLAQDNVALSAAQKTAIAEQLAQAKRSFEVGTATITDTHEAQARFDLATAKEISDQSDLEIKQRALQQLTGRPPEKLAALKEQVTLPLPQPNDMQQWVDSAVTNNLSVVNQRAAAEIASQEVTRNRAGHLPTLDLVASHSDNRNAALGAGGRIDTKNSQIGVQLAIPIYQGGLTNSRVREALANRDKGEQDLENARRSVAQQARQSFLGVANGVAQVKALEQALVSSQSSLDSTKLGREVGVRTNVDVLNAQQQLFQARRDMLQARYNTILSQLKLKLATGSLNEADLGEVNKNLTAR